MFNPRIRSAIVASLTHLVASAIVALLCAALVFGIWYPYPYRELMGGTELFLLMVSVDVTCGPLLTLVAFNPRKPRRILWRDIGTIVIIQIAALIYGLYSTAHARPVFLAFEGDRFRMVGIPDIPLADKAGIRPESTPWRLQGPRPIGVRLAVFGDPEYLDSIRLALEGLHPAFRPERWVPYEQQRQTAVAQARPLATLRDRHPDRQRVIESGIRDAGRAEDQLGYLPLQAGGQTDWVVLISLADGEPRGYLPLSGW